MNKTIHIPIAGELNLYPNPAEESVTSIPPPSYQSTMESEKYPTTLFVTEQPSFTKQSPVNPNSEVTADENDDDICPKDMTRTERCYCVLSIIALILACPLFCLYAIIMGQFKKSVW